MVEAKWVHGALGVVDKRPSFACVSDVVAAVDEVAAVVVDVADDVVVEVVDVDVVDDEEAERKRPK